MDAKQLNLAAIRTVSAIQKTLAAVESMKADGKDDSAIRSASESVRNLTKALECILGSSVSKEAARLRLRMAEIRSSL